MHAKKLNTRKNHTEHVNNKKNIFLLNLLIKKESVVLLVEHATMIQSKHTEPTERDDRDHQFEEFQV